MMTILVKYRDLFLEHMLVMEHGVMFDGEEDVWAPLKQGFVCFAAFTAFGLVPLLGFIGVYAVKGDEPFSVGCVMPRICDHSYHSVRYGFDEGEVDWPGAALQKWLYD